MLPNGKHALIAGSSRGIGRVIALKLEEKGIEVAINYYQNETAANNTLPKCAIVVLMASSSRI